MSELKEPISHYFNQTNGARFADFGGWKMPTFYSSIIEEHKATREHIGLFDVSHMGRWLVSGKEALSFLNDLVTNDLETLFAGSGIYTAMLNEQGGIIDDLIIYKIGDEEFMLVNNAGNHDIDTAWYEKQIENYDAEMIDMTEVWGQIAVQGPMAKQVLEQLLGIDEPLEYFGFGIVDCDDDTEEPLIIAATGYTGEEGYELYGDPDVLMDIWEDLIDEHDATPCGLGSRDLLRLEAGYCLHGNDIDTKTTPYEAGLSWVTKMDKEDFIGKSAATRKDKKLIGLAFPEGNKIIPRSHTKVLNEAGEEIGEVTSGNFSSMLNRGIALAYVKPDYQETQAKVLIRDKEFIAQVGKPWFYRNIGKKQVQEFKPSAIVS